MKPRPSSIKDLLGLAWPIYIAQMAMIANSIIDTVMAGRLSAFDLAAVGIAASIQTTLLMSLTGILLALPPLIAHLQGSGQMQAIGREIHQSLWISLALSVLGIVLLRCPGPFIQLSHLQPVVELKVRAYLDASSWGVPAMLLFRVFGGLFTGIAEPQIVMHLTLLTLALKFPMNALFMYGWLHQPALGAAGCAWATSLLNWLVALVAWSWCLTRPRYAVFMLSRRLSPPDWAAILIFLRIGLPIALTFIADLTAFTFMALFIARLGPIMSGAHQIAANLVVIAFMLPLSLGNAATVLVGKAMGANQPLLARNICQRALGLGILLALAVSLTLWSWAPQIAALYSSDEQVRAAAIPLIMMVGWYHLADALQAVTVNALRGYQRTAIPMLIYSLGLWGLGLGGGFVLGLTPWLGPARGAAGFWLAAVISLTLVGCLMTIYLHHISQKEISHRPLDHPC